MGSSCSPIRQNYRRHLAENMLKDIQTISSNNYFLTIGKITPWPTEDVGASLSGTNYARPVPVPTDSDSVETEFWQNVVAAKRVTSDNISLVIPRFDWKLGSVYQPYRDYTYLFDPDYPSQFYVLVDDTRVYKCIDNNYGATSTIAPTHTDPEIRKLADGYRWKFMYQISEDKRKFMTKTVYDETLQSDTPYRRVIIQGYMPVSYVEYLRMSDDDRVLQWNVQESAINGEISFVGIKEQYKPYLTVVNCLKPDNQNVIQEGYTAGHTGSVRLYSPYLIGLNGIYDNLILSIDDGPGEGQRRIINSYTYSATGNYGTVVLDSSLSVGLSAGNSKFSIVPNVQIEGDGFPRDTTLNHFKEADIGLKFGPALNTGSSGGCDTTNIYNQSYVDSYEIIDGGRDYTRAEFKAIKGLTFTAGLTGIGSLNDTAEIVFSPPGGHGSNAIRELGTAAIMVVVEFSQTEKNTMTVANDYRQFGILKNPLLKNKQVRLRLGAIGLSGSFTVGGSLTQGPTGGISGATYSEASGTVVYWRKGPTGTGLSGVDKYGVSELIVKNVTGNFASTGRVHSTVSGSDSGWFDVVDVSERTVAGTEGRELLRLKVIPTTIYDPQTGGSAAAFQPGGEDFHPGMYIASIGNLESNIHNTHFTGSIFRWEPTIGTNTNATLYIEEPSGLPSRFEKLVEVDYYLRPSIPSRYGLTGATAGRPVNNTGTAIVVEIGDIIRDSPSLYDQTTSLRLSTSLSNPFGTNSFRQDSLIKSYAGLTAEASGLVLDWIAVDGATSGTLRLCGVQGQFAASSLISFRDNKGETAQTQIHSILHEDELKYRSGELTYIQNTQPITRSLEQREEIKVLFQF